MDGGGARAACEGTERTAAEAIVGEGSCSSESEGVTLDVGARQVVQRKQHDRVTGQGQQSLASARAIHSSLPSTRTGSLHTQQLVAWDQRHQRQDREFSQSRK